MVSYDEGMKLVMLFECTQDAVAAGMGEEYADALYAVDMADYDRRFMGREEWEKTYNS